MTTSKSNRPGVDDGYLRIDEQVERRRKSTRLADYALPQGFQLATPMPRQFWIGTQLRWGFRLTFGEHEHVAQYHAQIADDIQMGWAMRDFTAKLHQQGVDLRPGPRRESLTPRKVAISVLN